MRVDKFNARAEFRAEDGERMSVYYDNRGEPYRQGITFCLEDDMRHHASVFLDEREVEELRDLLNTLYPPRGT